MAAGRRGWLSFVGRLIVIVLVVACSSTPAVSPGTGPDSTPGPGTSPTLSSAPPEDSPDPPLDGPSRADLIMQAVADGNLDLPTALLYRAYSALALPGVPDEYMTGVPRGDDDVFQQMALLLPTLTPEMQAEYMPLLVRPTDPTSVFATRPVAMVGGVALEEPPESPPPPCRNWADSGNADNRFKVWMCTDNGLGTSGQDIASIVTMIKSFWTDMTKNVPEGMGPPMSDEYNAGDPADYGGDGRIDFYALEMGKGVWRNGPNAVPTRALAVAYTALPYTDTGQSSGFVVLNTDRLAWAVKFKQDLIHEFFHVLQFAHTITATAQDGLSHWFKEATAEWAETHYDRSNSAIPHQWFERVFQTSPAGLETNEEAHQYADYIWPFFMEQEAGASSVFNAWQQIGSAPDGDFDAVSEAISDQLPFKDHFHDFALRNLDLGEPLASAGVKRYRDMDVNFPEGQAPTNMVQGQIAPGEPYVSPPAPAPPLGAAYYSFFVALPSKEITLDVRNVTPADARDGDALVHVDKKWIHYPVSDVLKLCEDDLGGNVDQIYLVVSDHDRKQPLLGTLEASAKESCDVEQRIVGDLTWDEQVVDAADVTHTTSGSAHVDAVWDPTSGWQVQDDSRYTLHYEQSDCSPSGVDSSGPLTWTDIYSPMPDNVGSLHVQGAPEQDLPISIEVNAGWVALCSPTGGVGGEPARNAASYVFPGCSANTSVTALWVASQSQYVVRCEAGPDIIGPGRTVSGSVNGILTPDAVPSPR